MQQPLELLSPLGPDLLIRRMSGEEGLGRLFEYRLDLLSPRTELDPDALLGQRITVQLEQSDGTPRCFNGHVARIQQTGHDGRCFTSQAVIRPWLWLLTRRTDCRIFQDLTVPEIIRQVFDGYPDVAAVDLRLSGEYRKWEYCVQYRESDFNFISRLMEHEGIYYYFEHSESLHRLILVDAFATHQAAPEIAQIPYYAEESRGRSATDHVRQWNRTREIRSGQYSTRDYDFRLPHKVVEATKLNTEPPALDPAEVFDYPGGYIETPHGEQYADVRLGELQTGHESASGLSNCRSLRAGCVVALTQHPNPLCNIDYLITRTTLQASTPHLESTGGPAEFGCSFSVVPAKQQYRPRRATPKPVMQGPQTAVVVGPDGDEIYVDRFGRVKVRFHWDRHAPKDNKEENRSCWIRVSQSMAGKNWGFVAIPRVKQEVIVDFLEGDPDQPIITGRVYNGDQMPPYDLPANATQTGLKTRSSKGGSPANYNEIRFEDKKGEEMVTVHAERDMSSTVERNDTTSVGNDQSLTVGHDQDTRVKHHQTLTVDHERTISVGDNETHTVGKSQVNTIGIDQFNYINVGQATIVGGTQQTWVGLKPEESVDAPPGSTRVDATKGDEFHSVTGKQTTVVGGDQSVEVTGELKYKAAKMTFETPHFDWNITGANSANLNVPIGPYTMFANKLQLVSNTDVGIFAAGNINQTSIGSNTTVLGSENSGAYTGNSSDFKMGTSRSTFLGLQMSNFAGLSSNTVLAPLQLESALALKISSSIGAHLELNGITMYGAPGSAAVQGGADAVKAGVATVGRVLNWLNVLGGTFMTGLDAHESEESLAKARAEMREVAREAAREGYPGIAVRFARLSLKPDEDKGIPDHAALIAAEAAPTNTDFARGSELTLVDKAVVEILKRDLDKPSSDGKK